MVSPMSFKQGENLTGWLPACQSGQSSEVNGIGNGRLKHTGRKMCIIVIESIMPTATGRYRLTSMFRGVALLFVDE